MGDIPVGSMNVPRGNPAALLAALMPRRRRVLGSARGAAAAAGPAGMSPEDWKNAEEYQRALSGMRMNEEAQKHGFTMERTIGEGAVKLLLGQSGSEQKIAEARAKGQQDRAAIRAKAKADQALLGAQTTSAADLYALIAPTGGRVQAGNVSASLTKKSKDEEDFDTTPDNASRSQAFSGESPSLGVIDTPGQDNDEQPHADATPVSEKVMCSQHGSKCTNRGKYKEAGYCPECGESSAAYCDKHYYSHFDEAHM